MSWIEGISQERESWLKQRPCSYCRCESSSSTHSLRNTFPERKLSQSHVHLPQECLSSCSRHPSSPLSTLLRGDHIHTDEDELDVLKALSLSTLFSCDFRRDTVLQPPREELQIRDPVQFRYKRVPFFKTAGCSECLHFQEQNLTKERFSLIEHFHPQVQQKEKYV